MEKSEVLSFVNERRPPTALPCSTRTLDNRLAPFGYLKAGLEGGVEEISGAREFGFGASHKRIIAALSLKGY